MVQFSVLILNRDSSPWGRNSLEVNNRPLRLIGVPFSIRKLSEIGPSGANSSFYLYIFTLSTLFHFCSVQSCFLRENWDAPVHVHSSSLKPLVNNKHPLKNVSPRAYFRNIVSYPSLCFRVVIFHFSFDDKTWQLWKRGFRSLRRLLIPDSRPS